MRQIIIRPPMPQEILLLCEAACSNTFSAHWKEGDFLSELSCGSSRLYAAFYEEDFTGFIAGRFCCGEGEINNIAVCRNFLRQGIGSVLLEYFIGKAQEENISKIVLEVSEKNTAALALYKKFSFNTVNIRKKFYNNKDDAYLMIKGL